MKKWMIVAMGVVCLAVVGVVTWRMSDGNPEEVIATAEQETESAEELLEESENSEESIAESEYVEESTEEAESSEPATVEQDVETDYGALFAHYDEMCNAQELDLTPRVGEFLTEDENYEIVESADGSLYG